MAWKRLGELEAIQWGVVITTDPPTWEFVSFSSYQRTTLYRSDMWRTGAREGVLRSLILRMWNMVWICTLFIILCLFHMLLFVSLIYVCVYTCMCVYVYVCIRVCVYTCMCVYMYVCIRVCVYTCMCVYVYVCIRVCVYTCMCVYVYTCMCVYVYVCIRVCVYTYVHPSIYHVKNIMFLSHNSPVLNTNHVITMELVASLSNIKIK